MGVKPTYDELIHLNRELSKKVHELEVESKKSDMWSRKIIDETNDGIFINSFKSGRIIEANRKAWEMLGYRREEFLSKRLLDMDRKFSKADIIELGDRLLKEKRIIIETNHQKKDGSTLDVEVSASLIDFQGEPSSLNIVRDISDRKRVERALKESVEKYRHLFNSGNDAIFVQGVVEGRPGLFIDVNDVASELYGYTIEEFMRMQPDHIELEENLEELKAVVLKKLFADKKLVFVSNHVKKDGTFFQVEVSSSVIELHNDTVLYSIVRDISERKRAEKEKEKLQTQLTRAQRMEALGTLAGGIAHDFNNLLTGVLGRTTLMQDSMDSSSPLNEHLNEIENHVKSATDLTRQLLGLARGGKFKVEPVDINLVLLNSSEMFGRTKKEIIIKASCREDIWVVEADKSQIEQVFLNLFVNAWQAMPKGGDLYLETENVVLDSDYIKPFKIKPGNYVKVSVTDTGTGIDKKICEKIFDPFFTTKEMGRGTGLGLASAYGIIKNHGGVINIYSELGEGTTFNIYLPASDKEVVQKKEVLQETLQGTETILLIDDEEIVVEVGKKMLTKLGYNVLTARKGKDAVVFYGENRDKIDGIILDMIMPEMSGSETFGRLKEINPDVKVLLSSGYSVNGQAQEIMDRGCSGFIQKPFSLNQLSQRVRAMFDKK